MDYGVVGDSGTFVIGVSGGVDSMYVLDCLVKRFGSERFVVAHVHHGFRSESDEEYDFVKGVCEGYGVAFEGVRLDMPENMKWSRDGLQEASRKYRYAFYKEVWDKYGADGLILGHHGDDLVETMLMKQMSGAFGRSGIGMVGRREDDTFGMVIRPLIRMSKEEVYIEAEKSVIVWREDPSNEGNSYMRNRIRNSILPVMKKEKTNVHLNYVRYAEEKREEEEYFYRIVATFLDVHSVEVNGMLKVDTSAFLALDPVIKKRVVLAITDRYEECVFSRNMVDALSDVVVSNRSGDVVYVAGSMFVVSVADHFYVMDARLKDSLADWNDVLEVRSSGYRFFEKMVIGNDVRLRLVDSTDRLANGKRVTKALKELKIPTAFRKDSRVLVVDGTVTAVVCMGSVVLT